MSGLGAFAVVLMMLRNEEVSGSLHSQAAQYTAGQRARLRTCDLAVARCRSGQFPGPPVDAMLPLRAFQVVLCVWSAGE